MATASVVSGKPARVELSTMNFEQAIQNLSRDERFRATVYAMNTLLQQKGVYSPEEFESQFVQFARKSADAS